MVSLVSAGDLSASREKANGGDVEYLVFRFRSSALEDSGQPSRSSRCVATKLAPGAAVTASHCLFATHAMIEIMCETPVNTAGPTKARFLRVVRHPTHDVAVFHLHPPDVCGNGTLAIAQPQDSISSYSIPIPPRTSGEVMQIQTVWPSIPRDQANNRETLDVRVDLCLREGDSGVPLLTGGPQRETAISGLLIGGDPDCSGVQTFVRLEKLRDWLTASISE
ncbi:MAG: hypothetical protein AAGI72_05595 [Pseudomonadota bacterium]